MTLGATTRAERSTPGQAWRLDPAVGGCRFAAQPFDGPRLGGPGSGALPRADGGVELLRRDGFVVVGRDVDAWVGLAEAGSGEFSPYDIAVPRRGVYYRLGGIPSPGRLALAVDLRVTVRPIRSESVVAEVHVLAATPWGGALWVVELEEEGLALIPRLSAWFQVLLFLPPDPGEWSWRCTVDVTPLVHGLVAGGRAAELLGVQAGARVWGWR